MHTLKRILICLSLTLSFGAQAAGELTTAQFDQDLIQLKKDVQSKNNRTEALAVIEKYAFTLMDQTKEMKDKKSVLYHRATGMVPRLAILVQGNCDDMGVALEFGDGDMASDEDTEPSPDLKLALDLEKILCPQN
jgi:hypothetical protein